METPREVWGLVITLKSIYCIRGNPCCKQAVAAQDPYPALLSPSCPGQKANSLPPSLDLEVLDAIPESHERNKVPHAGAFGTIAELAGPQAGVKEDSTIYRSNPTYLYTACLM